MYRQEKKGLSKKTTGLIIMVGIIAGVIVFSFTWRMIPGLNQWLQFAAPTLDGVRDGVSSITSGDWKSALTAAVGTLGTVGGSLMFVLNKKNEALKTVSSEKVKVEGTVNELKGKLTDTESQFAEEKSKMTTQFNTTTQQLQTDKDTLVQANLDLQKKANDATEAQLQAERDKAKAEADVALLKQRILELQPPNLH